MSSAPSLSRLLLAPVREEMRYTKESDHVLHVSDLFALCLRKVYLLWESGEKEYRTIDGGTQMLFAAGKAREKGVYERLAAVGVIETEQPQLAHADLGLVAHPDGRLLNGSLLEIKAKNPYLYKFTKNAPLLRDRFQVESYLWLDQTKEAILLTVSENSARDQRVHYNVKTAELIKKSVGELREAEQLGKPPRRVCQDMNENRAILCPMRDRCFGSDSHGHTQTIEEQLKAA